MDSRSSSEIIVLLKIAGAELPIIFSGEPIVDQTSIDQISLANYIYPAIQKQYIAIVTHEAAIIAGGDLEAVHQMRVSLRRLRSIIQAFASVVDIPQPRGELQMGRIAKVLGKVRDLDVLEAGCKIDGVTLPKSEQPHLNEILKTISKRRRKAILKVQLMFDTKEYQYFKLAINNWLNHPQYTLTAAVPITEILPNLILPVVGQLFLDPGWWLNLDLPPIDNGKSAEIHFTSTDAILLHQLRKQVKSTRYLMELFIDQYGSHYSDYLKDFKQTHQLLGSIQDQMILDNFIQQVLGKRAINKIPIFHQQLAHDRYLDWQNWQPIQHKYRQLDTRQELELLLIRGVISS